MAETGQEKRATRRFALRLPVSVTYSENGSQEKTAQTRDVSARGICFYLDSAIIAGSPLEFTLTLPPENTLTESIRVRCKGKVVRVDNGAPDGKVAVAAVIDEYEFLSEALNCQPFRADPADSAHSLSFRVNLGSEGSSFCH